MVNESIQGTCIRSIDALHFALSDTHPLPDGYSGRVSAACEPPPCAYRGRHLLPSGSCAPCGSGGGSPALPTASRCGCAARPRRSAASEALLRDAMGNRGDGRPASASRPRRDAVGERTDAGGDSSSRGRCSEAEGERPSSRCCEGAERRRRHHVTGHVTRHVTSRGKRL